jgi:hypothetical protein
LRFPAPLMAQTLSKATGLPQSALERAANPL